MRCLNPVSVENLRYGSVFRRIYPNATRFNLVPCGKCHNCLVNYINYWSLRYELECRSVIYSRFVTLTYSDEDLPLDGVSKRDVQLYFKKLRKHYDFPLLKYSLISEYGPTTLRPHYHFIGWSDIDIDYELFWNKGFVTVDEVIPERMCYIAKYHVIKGFIQGKPGSNETFRLQSRGIGLKGFTAFELENAVTNDYAYIYSSLGYKVGIPKYFRDKCQFPKYLNLIDNSYKIPLSSRNSAVEFNTDMLIKKFVKKSKL